MIKQYLYGLLARFINWFVPSSPRHWVFASDYGNLYRESSKYLFEYMHREHPEFHCTYIVRNPQTYNEIMNKGFPVVMNVSLKGIMTIARADAVFMSQAPNDMCYAYKKKERTYYYLNHGQSLKKQMKALPIEYKKAIGRKGGWNQFKNKISKIICYGFSTEDSEFVSANSEFFIPFLKLSYGVNMPVKILGMPRNDALFHHNEMKSEYWMKDLEGKFIITYMPTHRKYGKGDLTPVPFCNRLDVQDWLRNNNCILLMKQHPNMISKLKEDINNDVIRDISKLTIDPQVLIYHSDVLISDYSSVWLDYLLLRRPLITYIYDDFEKNDAGLNIDIRKETPGHLCFSEDDLYITLMKIKENYNSMIPDKDKVAKFYLNPDGYASRRYYNEIVATKYS